MSTEGAAGQREKISIEKAKEVREKLRAKEEKPKTELTKYEMVEFAFDDIRKMLESKGYSFADVSDDLRDIGVEIPEKTLKSYYQKIKATRSGKPRKPRAKKSKDGNAEDRLENKPKQGSEVSKGRDSGNDQGQMFGEEPHNEYTDQSTDQSTDSQAENPSAESNEWGLEDDNHPQADQADDDYQQPLMSPQSSTEDKRREFGGIRGLWKQ